ncbi:MAG: nuclear transport factor 2 family protein [Deltaproteobacteria bacterium]|nr:nuclear transport factor 2 family protein [Deltaproteobacteria bacterium]
MVPDDYGCKLKISALCVKILAILLVLIAFQGCNTTEGKLALFLEKPRIEKAVERYFAAEINRNFKDIYGCLAPSSIYRSIHTYGEYLEQVQGSPVRIKDYHILNIHDLRGNHDKVKYPEIEKFVRVEVDVTLLYNDSNETMEVNQDFTFIKEGGKWYKG